MCLSELSILITCHPSGRGLTSNSVNMYDSLRGSNDMILTANNGEVKTKFSLCLNLHVLVFLPLILFLCLQKETLYLDSPR